MPENTFAVTCLGCPKNRVDAEYMIGLLEAAGYQLVQDPSAAAVLIVQTCAFIDQAQEESIAAILDWAQWKKEEGRLLVVSGCLPQRYGEQLADLLPEVDLFVGNGLAGELPRLLAEERSRRAGARAAAAPAVRVGAPGYLPEASLPRRLTTPGGTAYVKIADGCNHRCAYCVVPRLRGPYRSRPREDLVQEVKALVGCGVREVVLVAQDTTSYGIDLYRRPALPELLEDLEEIEGLEWVRLLYAHPSTVTPRLLQVMAASRKLCRYLDLPLQHVDEAILRRIGRPGGREAYRDLIQSLRAQVPGLALRTTFIVGLPGETEAAFASLLDFLRELRLERVGIFAYSPQEGTPAADFPDQVPPRIRRRRRRQALALQQGIARELNAARVGTEERVLVEGPLDGRGLRWRARSQWEAPEVDGCLILRGKGLQPGRFARARIIAAGPYDLVAEAVPEEESPASERRRG
ncbi:MAG: 30S ribosomal protein S12 methylthiotransferase RimO [Bacillota bacterium]|nr:30S ribosomal protein S12 methylthiotransferase RimO [Bacillota bacterium]